MEAAFSLSPPQWQSSYLCPLLRLFWGELLSPSLKCIDTNPTPNTATGAAGGFLEGLKSSKEELAQATFLTSSFPISVPSLSSDQLSAHNLPSPLASARLPSPHVLVSAQNSAGKVNLRRGCGKSWRPTLPSCGLCSGSLGPHDLGRHPMPSQPRATSSKAMAENESSVCPTPTFPWEKSKGTCQGDLHHLPPTLLSAPLLLSWLRWQGTPGNGQETHHSQSLRGRYIWPCISSQQGQGELQSRSRPPLAFPVTLVQPAVTASCPRWGVCDSPVGAGTRRYDPGLQQET